MTEKNQEIAEMSASANEPIFDRVVSILEQARSQVVCVVNSSMVWAYWLIGREIVEELQGGEERAEYGKKILENLSKQLTARYGRGFSLPNLKRFRQFYQTFSNRGISSPAGSQFESETAPRRGASSKNPHPVGDELRTIQKSDSLGAEFQQGFSPQLSWTHYRILMSVKNKDARNFYERETIEGGWSKRTLERQIHTQYYERSLHAQQPEKMIAEGRQLQKASQAPDEILKNPVKEDIARMRYIPEEKLEEFDSLEEKIKNSFKE